MTDSSLFPFNQAVEQKPFGSSDAKKPRMGIVVAMIGWLVLEPRMKII